MSFNKGEVWLASFPFEEDATQFSNRPVVVMDENRLGVLSVKITKHALQPDDNYDVPILQWKEAGLKLASTARVSKVILLQPDDFIFKIGRLTDSDLQIIENKLVDFLSKQ